MLQVIYEPIVTGSGGVDAKFRGWAAGWVHSMASGTAFQQIQLGFLTSTEYQARALRGFP